MTEPRVLHPARSRGSSGLHERPGRPLGPTSVILLLLGTVVAALLPGRSPVLAAEAANVSARAVRRQDDPLANKPPLSTIVEIQNHGERFFDQTDAAAAALNKIAEQDAIWEAARAAKARADANPADQAAQQAYRAARARFFHQRIQIFLEALKLEQAVQQVHEAFCNQLDVEIATVQKQAETEKLAVQRESERFRDYLSQLIEVRERIEGAKDLDPRDVKLLKDIERELKNTEHQKVLAKERELLAIESLRDLAETRSQADQCLTELQDEFAQARGDLGLLQGIARNDWMIVIRQQRKEVLDRYQRRQTITSGDNRQVVAELMDRIRDRQVALAAAPSSLDNDAANENREQVDAFLKNLPTLDAETSESPQPPPGVTHNQAQEGKVAP